MSTDFLTQDEADKMLSLILGNDEIEIEEVGETANGVKPYEMGRQERIVRGRMPTLEIINERFGRYFRVGLFQFMKKNPEITVGAVKVQKYADFIRNLAVPANLNLINLDPFRGQALVIFDPSLVDTVVDAMFGGRSQYKSKIEGREFTETEQRIIRNMLDVAFVEYAKAWQPVQKVEPSFVRAEMHTQFVSIANPSEIVISTSFSIEIGSAGGMMHICFPYSMVEPIRDALSSTMQSDQVEPDKRWTGTLRSQIESTKVEIVADFAKTVLTLKDIATLRVGDFIPLDVPEYVDARVDDVPVLRCKYGVKGSKYSLKVQSVYAEKLENALALANK